MALSQASTAQTSSCAYLDCHALAFVCGEAFVRQLFQAWCRPGGLTLFAFTLGDILNLSAASVFAVVGWELDWNCAESSDTTMHIEHWLIMTRGPEILRKPLLQF